MQRLGAGLREHRGQLGQDPGKGEVAVGATSGDAYGFVQSNCGFKIENIGGMIGTVGVKMDNFALAIANGAIEIKNKSMKAYTYTFALKTGFTLHS